MGNKIRFIDSKYNKLFEVEDGEEIIITHKDGLTLRRKCKYVDEYHTRIGNSVYHICEFAEKMEGVKATYIKANMKYYEFMILADNPVGANFRYCNEIEAEEFKISNEYNSVDEISKEEYELGLERQHRKFLYLATGF